MCVCQKSGAHAFGSVRDTRDTHGGENVDTPIGQFLLIGNFRRRLARELLVIEFIYLSIYLSVHLSICTGKPEKRLVRVDAARSIHSTEDMVQV